MSVAKFLLEHFYYGQVVNGGKPVGELQLLASSPGITEKIVSHAVSRVNLPPLIRTHKGAWALVRGRSRQLPFLLVQSQQGRAGQLTQHYIVLQPDVLRTIGGNLQVLLQAVEDDMPVFDKPNNKIQVLDLDQGEPLSIDRQIDDILELMTVTRNSTSMIEKLLGAIVQGTQLIIQGAPNDLEERMQFIKGLLALLPGSARFGVTFTTHSLPTTEIDTQIRFYSDDLPPAETTVFNWVEKRITGVEIEDDYSRFIVSLLRLDAELVIQRNMLMTNTAGWRLNEGDKLAEALGYAAHRFRIDEALKNNQPADKDAVSKILAEDPTLDDELRVLYAKHLVNFSLAMQDMQHAAPVALLLRSNPSLAQSILQQMTEALEAGEAWLIYDTLVDWMSNPLGPEGTGWVKLTHRAALGLIDTIIEEQDTEELNLLVTEFQNTDPGVAIGRIVPQILQKVLPVTPLSGDLAQNVFLLAAKYLDIQAFINLMNVAKFRQTLGPKVSKTWALIFGDQTQAPPDAMLVKVARDYGDEWETLVLLRLAEASAIANHITMFDNAVLEGLIQIAQTATVADQSRLKTIIRTLNEQAVRSLQPPGPRYVLQLHLITGDYPELAKQMLNQSRILYPGDLQLEYVRMVEELFSKTPLPVEQVPLALSMINEAGIKSAPYVAAISGALDAQKEGSEACDALALSLCDYLVEDTRLLEVLPEDVPFNILRYFGRRENVDGTLQAASVLAQAAAYRGKDGIVMIAGMYHEMTWHPNTRRAAVEMLRIFVRRADDAVAAQAVDYFGKELGETVKISLDVTYQMKRLLGPHTIEEYVEIVVDVSDFLTAIASLFTDSRNSPSTNQLQQVLDGMPGGLIIEERRDLSKLVVRLGRGILRIGKQYRTARPRDEERYILALLEAKTSPRSLLDVFYVMGGHLSKGRRIPVKYIERGDYPLQGRTARWLMDSVITTLDLLENAAQAFPADQAIAISASQIQDELDSMWGGLPDETQKELLRDFATSLQRVPDLVSLAETQGDARLFEDTNLARRIDEGRQSPSNVLEFLRYLYAYYDSRS